MAHHNAQKNGGNSDSGYPDGFTHTSVLLLQQSGRCSGRISLWFGLITFITGIAGLFRLDIAGSGERDGGSLLWIS